MLYQALYKGKWCFIKRYIKVMMFYQALYKGKWCFIKLYIKVNVSVFVIKNEYLYTCG